MFDDRAAPLPGLAGQGISARFSNQSQKRPQSPPYVPSNDLFYDERQQQFVGQQPGLASSAGAAARVSAASAHIPVFGLDVGISATAGGPADVRGLQHDTISFAPDGAPAVSGGVLHARGLAPGGGAGGAGSASLHQPDAGATYQTQTAQHRQQQFGVSTRVTSSSGQLTRQQQQEQQAKQATRQPQQQRFGANGAGITISNPPGSAESTPFVPTAVNGQIQKDIVCSQCQSTFGDQGSLARHAARAHRVAGTKGPAICDQCNASLKNEQNLKRHVAVCHTGEQDHICQMCNASFTSRGSLRIHQQTVHNVPTKVGRKQAAAAAAAAAAASSGDLMEAARKKPKPKASSKGPTKSWACDMCTDTFKWKGNLKRHRELRHLHLRPYLCTICNASFGTKSNMRVHLITHDRVAGYGSLANNAGNASNAVGGGRVGGDGDGGVGGGV